MSVTDSTVVGMTGEQITWQPVSAVPMLTALVDGGIELATDQLDTLREARPPSQHVLDDATVGHVIRVYKTTRTDLAMFAEQGQRWLAEQLNARQRRDVEHYVAQVARERQLVEDILTLADELGEVTIERVLAKSDFEVGLMALPWETVSVPPPRAPAGSAPST